MELLALVLSLFDGIIGSRPGIYRGALLATLVFSAIDALSAAGLGLPAITGVLSEYVPFYGIQMGWLVPAVLGAAVGGVLGGTVKEPVVEAEKG